MVTLTTPWHSFRGERYWGKARWLAHLTAAEGASYVHSIMKTAVLGWCFSARQGLQTPPIFPKWKGGNGSSTTCDDKGQQFTGGRALCSVFKKTRYILTEVYEKSIAINIIITTANYHQQNCHYLRNYRRSPSSQCEHYYQNCLGVKESELNFSKSIYLLSFKNQTKYDITVHLEFILFLHEVTKFSNKVAIFKGGGKNTHQATEARRDKGSTILTLKDCENSTAQAGLKELDLLNTTNLNLMSKAVLGPVSSTIYRWRSRVTTLVNLRTHAYSLFRFCFSKAQLTRFFQLFGVLPGLFHQSTELEFYSALIGLGRS